MATRIRLVQILFAAVIAITALRGAAMAEELRFSIRVGVLPREYVVHVPPGYSSNTPAPVVIMYHGGGGTAEAARFETGWTGKADEEGFLVVFPEGARPHPSRRAQFIGNPQTWNDGSGRFHAGQHAIDDVGFTRALLDDLQARYAVDGRRIFATGFSNGSSMAYRVGVELSERIAAIAPVASSGLRLGQVLRMQRPMPLLAIAGAADPLNPLEGGVMANGEVKPSIRTTIETWTRLLECPSPPVIDTEVDGLGRTVWRPCRGSAEVEFIIIANMGHTWPGGRSLLPERVVGRTTHRIRAVDVIWEFFRRHPLPAHMRE